MHPLLKLVDLLLMTIWVWLLPAVLVLIVAFLVFEKTRDLFWKWKNRIVEASGEAAVPEAHLVPGPVSPRRRDHPLGYFEDTPEVLLMRREGRVNEPLEHLASSQHKS